jgi:hypothetical protein
MIVGGANLSVFFTANETTGVWGTTSQLSLQKKLKTSVTRTTFTIDQNEDDPSLTDFIELYAPASQAAADTGEYEDGVKFNSATANSQTLGQIIYGAKYAGASVTYAGKRKVVVMLCKLAQDAGAFEQESGKYTKPKISGEVVNNDVLVTIPASIFATGLVNVGAVSNFFISQDKGYRELWISAV